MTILRFYKKRRDRSRYTSLDGRWCAQRVELPAPEFFIWVLVDAKTGARYERPSLMEAVRTADRKMQLEVESGSAL